MPVKNQACVEINLQRSKVIKEAEMIYNVIKKEWNRKTKGGNRYRFPPWV